MQICFEHNFLKLMFQNYFKKLLLLLVFMKLKILLNWKLAFLSTLFKEVNDETSLNFLSLCKYTLRPKEFFFLDEIII